MSAERCLINQFSLLAWVYATISILIISLCGLIGVAIVPLTKSIAYDDILKFLVALAVGTLCGDALMVNFHLVFIYISYIYKVTICTQHLLPHALTAHDNHGDETNTSEMEDASKNNDAIWLCGSAFLSALFMFALETLLPLCRKSSHSHSNSHQHPHHHHQNAPLPIVRMTVDSPKNNDISNDIELPKTNEMEKVEKLISESNIQKKSKLSPVALMVILGDGLHNITDGMAIGAAFAVDPVTGMATAFAVLCHELPHELGDFALLLQTGVSIRRAIFFNLVSSVLSMMGMVLGLVIAGLEGGFVRWIYAATAGTFLYIACADLVPEMRHNSDGQPLTLRYVLLQIIGVLCGGLIMLAIALNEHKIRILFE